MSQNFIVGKFVREERNRFLCTVNIEGNDEECYIPSSCRLENFLELAGKEVLLRENKNKNARTRLAIYAISFKKNYILLRTAEANDIVRRNISSRRFSYLGDRKNIEKECIIDGYKADLFLPESNTVIEIKSIISTTNESVFPTVFSERALEQLHKIKELLSKGYKVVYIYISLNPYVKKIKLSNDKYLLEYKKMFRECMDLGMNSKAYAAELRNGEALIKKEISIVIE